MKRLFTEGFTVLDIAEELLSFDGGRDGREVAALLEELGEELAGVRVAGRVAGYVLREGLGAGPLMTAMRPFEDGEVLADDAPLHDVLAALARNGRCFVSVMGSVAGVVVRCDLQKPPVRMWLFGLITILESWMSRTLEELYPNGAWEEQVSAGRMDKARNLLEERGRRGQQVRLIDCLQFSDKAQILFKRSDFLEQTRFPSKAEAKRTIRDLESLRNNLAHSQDIVTYDWETIVDLAEGLHQILRRI
jgi:hypothetical protein